MTRITARSLRLILSLLSIPAWLVLVDSASALVTLSPIVSTADTTIREDQSGDNFGAYNRMWIGKAGTKYPGPDRHGLVKFDLSSVSVPVGATISATLKMTSTDTHSVTQNIGLYRALVGWGEGTKTGKAGAAATAGEASWTSRQTGSASWTVAGGQSGSDFVAVASSTLSVKNTGAYSWTTGLGNDVAAWLADPSKNFGWFVMSDSTTVGSVMRFATREDTTVANRPTLTISYTISSFGVSSGLTPTLRVMKGNTTQNSAVAVQNSGDAAGTFSITSATGVNLSSTGQAVAALGTANFTAKWADTTTTGTRNGTFNVHNTTVPSDADETVTMTGAVVDNRAVSAAQVDFGRIAVGSTANKSAAATLTTSGDSNNYTNVTVKAAAVTANADGVGATAAGSDVVFNAATASMTRTVTLNKAITTAGLVSGSLALTVQGEGLTGENAAATVPYKYLAVNKRTVNGPSTALDFGNLLVGATVTAPITFTSTSGAGDDDLYTRVSIANQTATSGLVLSGTPVTFNGSVGTNDRTVSFAATTAGSISTTAGFNVTPENIGDTGYTPVNVNYKATVGNAAAKATPAGTSGLAAAFDTANKMVASTTTSYAGLSSQVTTGTGAVGTKATILAGAATPGQISMNWRTRADDEKVPGPMFPLGSAGGISDVLEVLGTGSDRFVLEMTYDPNLLRLGPDSELAEVAANGIYLGWLDPAQNGWGNAGTGTNQGKWSTFATSHGITDINAAIPVGLVGSWGVDTDANTVWVVTDHNSQYMAVPEPSTWLLGLLGGLAVLPILRKRFDRKATRAVQSAA